MAEEVYTYDGKRKGLNLSATEENVWELAVQRARQLYEQFDHVAVSFSGGKDSTATLHAMLAAAHEKPEERLPLRVIFWDEECIPPDTVDYARRVSQRDDVNFEWYCVPIKCGNACNRRDPYWYPWAPEDKDKWVRELPPEAITEIPGYDPTKPSDRLTHYGVAGYLFPPSKYGEAVQVLGIRAQESLRRLQAVNRRENDNWIIQAKESEIAGSGALWKAYPIYDWKTEDVWTAPAEFGWDYNTAYDKQEMHGVKPSQQRMGPPFGQEPMRSLGQWHACWPELWDKMVYRVPGAATAARYSTTELYSSGSYPIKPDGITWPEYLKQILAKRSPEEQRKLGTRMVQYIKRHHERTNGAPMPEHDWHPSTGCSWDYLAMICDRGDRMGRKDPSGRQISSIQEPEKYEAQLAKYHADIDKVKAEGRYKEII